MKYHCECFNKDPSNGGYDVHAELLVSAYIKIGPSGELLYLNDPVNISDVRSFTKMYEPCCGNCGMVAECLLDEVSNNCPE